MGKLDHNLDAYRLAATSLERLRMLLRRHLEAAHGTDWESGGVPEVPGEYLRQRRERETSVKWNSSSGTDLLDYAGFVNLFEILSVHPRLREGFARLVLDPHALRIRFLELDTVLNRIAYARPVSESDMELLLGFDERLRQVAGELTAVAGVPAADDAPVAASPPPRRPDREQKQPDPEVEPKAAPAPAPSRPAVAPQAPAPPPDRRPDQARRAPARPVAAPPEAATPPEAIAPPASTGAAPAPPLAKEFESALKRGEDTVLLSALYHEITGLAERLWSDGASAASPVWNAVSESTWYRERFSVLRLKVVSDFYDLLRAVEERRAAGSARGELHELLKERNFAQLLMDLREFFKPLLASAKRSQR